MTKNDRFRESRIKSGKSQDELAVIFGVSQSYISSLEKNSPFSYKKAKLFGEVLNVDADWLYYGDNNDTSVVNNAQSGERNKQHTSFTDSERMDVNEGSRINPTFPGIPDREENNITVIERYISPDHTPIPVYDDTGDIHNIDELLKNDDIKPVVLIMKGHLGCHAVVRHNDSAMDKDFLQGTHQKCQLGIQRVFHFKNTIIPGMAAIIILEEFTITRYVHRADNKDQLLLRSADTVLFPDMIIDIAHIKQMWRIKSVTPVVQSKILMY